MKILFTIVGAISFKAVNFLRGFIKQIDTQENSLVVLSEELSFTYLEADKKIKFMMMKEGYSNEDFELVLERGFDLIILVNAELLLFDDSTSVFKTSFLKSIKETKVLFLSTGNYLSFSQKNMYLTDLPAKKLKLRFPFGLIKSCPPYIPDFEEDDNVEVFYWKNLETFAFLNKDESRSKLKERIKSNKETKVVSLIVDTEQLVVASSQFMQLHYKVLIECIAYYLSKLDIECDFVIGNIPNFTVEVNYEKVKTVFLGPLSEAENEMLVRSSDLIITETIANPILIDAANLKIPVITMKNTLTTETLTDDEGEYVKIVHGFSELTPFMQSKVEDLINNCPNAIFPYFSFPNKSTAVFNQKKIFGLYIFNFSELFDEIETFKNIQSLLVDEEERKEEIYRIEQYLAMRSEALDAQEIIDSLINNTEDIDF